MPATQKPTLVVGEPRSIRPRRRLTLAGALAIVVISASACGGSDSAAAAEGSPLDLTERFTEQLVAGDWGGVGDLYTADATWQFLTPTGNSPVIRFADELPPDAEVADWDGDGVTTELDGFASLGAEVYAGGLTALFSCEQPDAETAVCEEAREGYAFLDPSHSANWTITVTDGLISNIVIDVRGDGESGNKVFAFQDWVKDTRPELDSDLFSNRGVRNITPENVETHRELATEWLATQ